MRTWISLVAFLAITIPTRLVLGQSTLLPAEEQLTASDRAASDTFGHSVAIAGDVALVGAMNHDSTAVGGGGVASGAAYVYRFDGTTWIEEQQLTASDGAVGDVFGFSVALVDDVALVGARYHDPAAVGGGVVSNGGAAYVYRFDGISWIEEQKLTASDGGSSDYFGHSVALAGDVALVGAYGQNPGSVGDAGAAYVYRFDGTSWIEEQKLTASDGGATDYFGRSVALAGDVALIGADRHDLAGGLDNAGATYVYRFDGTVWIEEQKLTASDGAVGDVFGWSVGLAGDIALVGAHAHDPAAVGGGVVSDAGAAYVYRFDGTTWIEEGKLTASDGNADDQFGWSVAIDGDVALVGASGADSGSLTDAGAAYLYRLGLTPFSRGDANADGHFNLADAIATLAHLFDGLALSCPRAADMNDDETIDMADVIYGLSTLFDDGPGLPAPLDCNIDPTPGALDCPTFLACP